MFQDNNTYSGAHSISYHHRGDSRQDNIEKDNNKTVLNISGCTERTEDDSL